MNWHEYPILRLVVPLVLGILFYMQFPQWAPPIIINLITLVIIGLLSWPKKYLFPYKHRYISGLLFYFAFFIMGIGLSQYHYSYHKDHYFANNLSKADYLMASIVEPPEEKPRSVKLIVEVTQLGNEDEQFRTDGLAVLYLEKDSISQNVLYGDVILFANKLKLLSLPQNPDEFDYKQYLNNSGIQYQAYLRTGRWTKTDLKSGNIIKAYSMKIRLFLLHELQRHGIQDAEFSVTAAMLLGVRSHLSPELRQSFSGAGAMHILCVSGLHVGIIFMLLNYLLVFFDRIKNGPFLRSVIILISIWAYAMITGLSPSVVRAATMFSFISIGQNIGRQVNTYNSLAASAFVLLVFNPFLIFDLGFQLSYSAVIAIIALQKPLQNLWTPRWNWLFKIWQLTTVSVAAQIGTAPLALYYFHSFPNYFLLTNLIVIPAAFAIFISGIVVLAFSWTGLLADYFAWILSKMVALLNAFITGVEHLPYAVSQNIYISTTELVLLMLLAIFISIMLVHRIKKLLIINLLFLILLIVANIYQKHTDDQFIVYQTGKYDYVSFIHDKKEYAFTDADVLDYPDILDYQTKEHRIRYHIVTRKLINFEDPDKVTDSAFYHNQSFVGFNNHRFLIVNTDFSTRNYTDSVHVDYVIVCGNPKISIQKLLTKVKCKKIIFASSLPPWTIKKWETELSNINIPTYFVKKEGAFVINFD